MIAEVVISSQAREIGKSFDYLIPSELDGTVTVGQRVTVPFGISNRTDTGFVVALKNESKIKRLKELKEIKKNQILSEDNIKLAKWISEKYFCNLGAAMELFFTDETKARKSKSFDFKMIDDFIPTDEQKYAIDRIESFSEKKEFKEFLLHGVTGSGKTEVYIQVIKKFTEKGRGAIVLVPEISLTPQTVKRFMERIGRENVAVFHSRLNKGQKYEEWEKVRTGQAKVVIGARSALFTPVRNLGIVIIDEEHDSSYKSGQTPFYHARDVAEELSKLSKGTLVLGSATPDISTFYRAKTGEMELISLTKRTNNKELPNVKIVDMRKELVSGNKTIFSNDLYNEIKTNLEKKEQTILFLNRRGYSTFVSCRNCGFVAKCRKCNIALTYHAESNRLICHYCGAKFTNPITCPVCHASSIKYFGVGTQKIEGTVKKLFPEATTIRMDLDTTGKKDSHEALLDKFRRENVDILIGTQMIAKGHDFPNVTLVGVVAADMSLNSNDFRAGERTFDLLTQVSGRAGRGEKTGRVIVQTYDCENYSIMAASKQDYESFYTEEILLREQMSYPPFSNIIVFNFSGTDENKVIQCSRNVRVLLNENLSEDFGVTVMKEVPAPISKINNKYRWRIILKCEKHKNVNNVINNLLKSEKFVTMCDVDYTIDVDPLTFN